MAQAAVGPAESGQPTRMLVFLVLTPVSAAVAFAVGLGLGVHGPDPRHLPTAPGAARLPRLRTPGILGPVVMFYYLSVKFMGNVATSTARPSSR